MPLITEIPVKNRLEGGGGTAVVASGGGGGGGGLIPNALRFAMARNGSIDGMSEVEATRDGLSSPGSAAPSARLSSATDQDANVLVIAHRRKECNPDITRTFFTPLRAPKNRIVQLGCSEERPLSEHPRLRLVAAGSSLLGVLSAVDGRLSSHL